MARGSPGGSDRHGPEAWLARARVELRTARHLAAIGQDWASVYWHAGQAVEFMLKALRMKEERLAAWPVHDKGAPWHGLTFIARRCRILPLLEHEARQGSALGANWLTVRDWDHQRRFPGFPITEREARDILTAVAGPRDGVMPWLLARYHQS